MERLRRRVQVLVVLIATLLCGASGYSVNTTVYGTNIAHVFYEPGAKLCIRWSKSWFFGRQCEAWAQPWTSEVIHNGQRLDTVHRSLNHQAAKLAIEFTAEAYSTVDDRDEHVVIFANGPSKRITGDSDE
ncbi:hypothetical protein BDV93DRAFT_604943 [Ceratobasidium sp. AG-I]|nr:hypothetical protein BDV93DRAFT_604943 [Ceratobasidium sp. AG-I]